MATDIISAYRSVCRDLKGLEAYEPIVRRRLEAAYKVVYGGRMPSSGSICYVPLDASIPDYNSAVDEFNETMRTIGQLNSVKAQMENIIASMTEPERMIIVMHVEQGLSLREIADKSNYSYGYLRQTAMGLREKKIS